MQAAKVNSKTFAARCDGCKHCAWIAPHGQKWRDDHRPQMQCHVLGNLDVARDFSDVRNVVQLYRRLLEAPAAVGQTLNVCSGQAWSLNDVLAMVREISGHDFEVRVNPAFVRQNEVKTLLGSRARLDAVVGEVPEIALRDTLRWMLEA